jgi:uncharacterized protein YuzE
MNSTTKEDRMTATDSNLPAWTFDEANQMGYLKVTTNEITRTTSYSRINVDFDASGAVVGIEVFH